MDTASFLQDTLDAWRDLVGISRDRTTFRIGDFDAYSMTDALENSVALDPSGITTLMMLECFLRQHLESKTFTAAAIMKDYTHLSTYLDKAYSLFGMVQSEDAIEIAANFRAKVHAGVAHYKSAHSDVTALIDNPDALPFLRRDALCALENLTAYQFLSGAFDDAMPHVFDHVYLAWNINDLLLALRDMPTSGVAMVLLRDPSHPERSHFCFAMRNGGNVVLFTDKKRPAYPGQEDVLVGRGAGRAYMKRAWSNHFPYHIIKTNINDRGDVIFEAETAPVAAGVSLVPLMPISALHPNEIVWATMILSLIADRFWKSAGQRPH